MADYDNTNRGAAFAPFETQKLILQGKINDGGLDRKVTFTKDTTRDGKNVIEVYEKIGVLFENDKKGNEAAPDYTGPFNEFKRLAAWRKMKDGKPYMTFNVSEPQQQSQPAQVASIDLGGDDIPF
jgi:hypothetical protein|tara:strand:+ start:175 stop:549 length:375 start_codon:yes stop_codon:yes gene_type:complete